MTSGRRFVSVSTFALALCGCAHEPGRHTLGSLNRIRPDTHEARIHHGLDKAMQSYRAFLAEAPQSALAPEAMRRLADLQIEQASGKIGDGTSPRTPSAIVTQTPPRTPAATVAHTSSRTLAATVAHTPRTAEHLPRPAPIAKIGTGAASKPGPRAAQSTLWSRTSERDLDARVNARQPIGTAGTAPLSLPGGSKPDLRRAGPLQAIRIYDELLAKYPSYQYADQVLYQKARAYDELGETRKSMRVMAQLLKEFPQSRFADEIHFRRGEYYFARRKYRDAQRSYSAIVTMGPGSQFYELALYKLGWTYFKEESYQQALHEYFALLDYKVSKGYDFDAKHSPAESRRVHDTFRAVSLSFSNIGGPGVVARYFSANGHRAYEDRVYRYLAEFYFSKLRYHDAAAVYDSFVAQYPYRRVSPRFSMRVVQIYKAGGFPDLVLEAKKDFATRYGLQSGYWRHFDVKKSPQVLSYLKKNLTDLAHYYHAQYQNPKLKAHKAENFAQATHWYRQYLASFHSDPQAPAINYQLADLLRENRDYAQAAGEYERTAYDYPKNVKSAAAGYEAVYSRREYLKVVGAPGRREAKRAMVGTSLKFADTFPRDRHAAIVLGVAAEDLYEMKDYALARIEARKLLARYQNTKSSVRRDAWLVVAHSSFELAQYRDAEQGFTRVLAATPATDPSRAGLVDNLAASIYEQGAQARAKGDYRAAANDFLRVKQAAPTSKICASAEYDASAALIKLKDWTGAARVLTDFRSSYPQNKLHNDATQQLAFVYRQAGKLARAAGEYEQVATEASNPKVRAGALLAAGDLYGKSKEVDHALSIYLRYVAQFPEPVEAAEQVRQKIAEIYRGNHDQADYDNELQEIVTADASAGAQRTDVTRTLAARAALVLTEKTYQLFAAVKLVQPFRRTLQEKQREMNTTLTAFDKLTAYEVPDVTAAATYYIAETYENFAQSLLASERPPGLTGTALKDYERQLAQHAMPFKQKAIEIHQKNLQLMSKGIYDKWIAKSLATLAVLEPARYARAEISSGFLDSLDKYVYRLPRKPTVKVVTGPSAPHALGGSLAQVPPTAKPRHAGGSR